MRKNITGTNSCKNIGCSIHNGFQGQASDIERHAQEILSLRSRLNDIYVKHTGQNLKTIEKALDRDTFMTSDDAMKFGLIDKVVENREINSDD